LDDKARRSITSIHVRMLVSSGVGKTMLALALARASIDAGYRTYYTAAADLVARCHRAALEGRWATTMRFFAGQGLLVIDEVGYLPLANEAASYGDHEVLVVITMRASTPAPSPAGRCGSLDRTADFDILDRQLAGFMLLLATRRR